MSQIVFRICSNSQEHCLNVIRCGCAVPVSGSFHIFRLGKCPFHNVAVKPVTVFELDYSGDTIVINPIKPRAPKKGESRICHV